MSKQQTYFPRTTAQQRRLLFEIWEATGKRQEACQRAHVSEGTFYKWKPRFAAGGYAALEQTESRAPKQPFQTAAVVAAQVVALRQAHPAWGKRRIADELAKANNWVPLVSPNTVKRILQAAGLWPTGESEAKKRGHKPCTNCRCARTDDQHRPLFRSCEPCYGRETACGQWLIGSTGGGNVGRTGAGAPLVRASLCRSAP